MAKLYSGPATDIPGTGPAPFLMRAEDWKRVGQAGWLAGQQRMLGGAVLGFVGGGCAGRQTR